MAGKILQIVPVAQSIALAGDNIEFLKKTNKDAGDFIGQATKNIVGVSLIGETIDLL